MEIKISNKNGIILKTANKLCTENITLVLDESLFGNNGNEEQSGFTLTLNCASKVLNTDTYTYSLDGGSTYNQFTSETMTLENVTQIMFYGGAGLTYMIVGTISGGNDIADLLDWESDNITLTQDTTWYVSSEFRNGGAN